MEIIQQIAVKAVEEIFESVKITGLSDIGKTVKALITAVTDLGRTMSVVLGIYGIIVVALITSIIVNFYGEIKKERPEEKAGDENTDPE